MHIRRRGPATGARAILTATCLALASCGAEAFQDAAPTDFRAVIFMVADGGGAGTWTVARLARGGDLAVARMPVAGLVDTRNADDGLTDSAAGATAYATGTRTYNRAISVGLECRDQLAGAAMDANADLAACAPLPTLLERAEAAGLSTGLVTTTAVTDATPAAFAAHVPSRSMYGEIARQMLASGVDVVLGGGRAHFDGTDPDHAVDLLSPFCMEADCPADAAELAATAPAHRPLVGLFAPRDLAPAGSRAPDLPTMTLAALERLERNEHGFFLLVESEGTDSRQHANDALPSIEAEILEFDDAVAVALAFADRVPGTLVVVTGDHETGGLAVHGSSSGPERRLEYTTGGHTHGMVPLFAYGPGAERLAGMRNNDEVGRILAGLLLAGR